jgi:hypothetical protein
MKKQTAVKWLEEKLSTSSSDELVGNINNWFEQAKQMEKEQIIKSNRAGVDMVIAEERYITGEDYYNETFGGTQC